MDLAQKSVSSWIDSRWTYACAVAAIFAIALTIRLNGLNDTPIWTDEAFTYIVAKLSPRLLFFGRIDNHPPLYYWLQHLWQSMFPALSLVRVPAALFGAVTVPVMTVAAGDLISKRAGLFAGTFLALSTVHVYFSQEARMYTLVCLGLCLAIWGLAGFIMRQRFVFYGTLYLLGGALAVYSHTIGLFFLTTLNIAACVAFSLTGKLRAALPRYLALNGLLLLIALPWLLALPENAATFPGLSRAGPDVIQWMVMNAIGFPGLTPWPMRLMTLGLFGFCLYGSVNLWKRGDKVLPMLLLGGLLLYPPLIALLSLQVNLIANRVFLPCALLAAILYAASLDALKKPIWRIGTFVVVSSLSLLSTQLEHGIRMKVENVPYALQGAAARGVADGPIIGCGFFGTISAHLLAPQRASYYLLDDSFMRFNTGYEKSFALPINAHRLFDARALNALSGGGLRVAKAEAEFQPYSHVVVFRTYCDAAKMAPTDAALTALGFHKADEVPPPNLRMTLEVNATPTELWVRNRSGQ